MCCPSKAKYNIHDMLLIFKATEQFKRINVNLKGPALVNNGKRSFLVVVDEYSIIPFIVPSCDCWKTTVIKCLTSPLSLVGIPAYVLIVITESCYQSKELGEFLTTKGVAVNKTTKY